ncbi:MAG: hypothetical protein JNJ59_24595 [Deltaproteobacteria bacterium]|nr:hypothetical protein [Deltaproteobacteria bacterium]
MKSPCISLVLLVVACDGPGGGGGSTALPTCNNGVLDPGEICDGTSVGANTCQTAGFERGLLVCNRYCTNFDTTGCSGGNGPLPDVIGGDTSSPDTAGGDTAVTPGNQAPQILSLTANTATLSAGSNLVVTAVVTDANGIDDLIGGQLETTTGGSFGAFSTSAAEGSYSITLTWDAIQTVREIDAPPSGVALDMKAVFYDVAGARAERTLRVTLRCDASGTRGLCGGECTALSEDAENCGVCGNACGDEPSFVSLPAAARYPDSAATCVESTCAEYIRVDPTRMEAGATCKTLCTAVGLSCPWPASVDVGNVTVDDRQYLLGCNETTPAGGDVQAGYCGCAPGTGVIIPPDPEPELATIVGIQSSSASVDCTASGDQLIGAEVTIEGVVTVPRFKLNTTLSGIFVSDGTQNAYSGLLVRFPTAQAYNFTKGQKVRVTGKHYEYYCMTQFAATAITAVGDGAVPAVRTIGKNLLAADYEKWESVAVKVDNVTVTDLTQYNEAETNAGVLIDDFILDTSFLPPSITTNYAYIRGILVYGFERYRVAPRDDSDY